ncbi:hypothetical protein BX616_000249 [Lobosporangium transversale]|uniref:Uncharacterized protein n=1 Tax=Lobosporangium transversale TaxID=64571 RepID=A0A1Y2H2F4_9FUNG|nr:hypothetical protein BCR41DRAFT_417864 [Lobosporangium transversale]KAF9917675.1 hypothetical protein BX616_000249 [Lobosporangium transversale]ORZ28728.1 hypothetical protein BCR41DRAFT_417864 [Lobosporangium transversale]|eukprot:XP_021886401.1 hypothetical protein BCR41DRAFT_417864 [Lobosporangium transversale]
MRRIKPQRRKASPAYSQDQLGAPSLKERHLPFSNTQNYHQNHTHTPTSSQIQDDGEKFSRAQPDIGSNNKDAEIESDDSISILLHEFDDDLENSISRKSRRVESYLTTSSIQRHQTSKIQKHGITDKIHRGSKEAKEISSLKDSKMGDPDEDLAVEDELLSSLESVDMDFRLGTASTAISSSITKATKSASSTHSISEAQNAIDDIDQMLMENSSTAFSPLYERSASAESNIVKAEQVQPFPDPGLDKLDSSFEDKDISEKSNYKENNGKVYDAAKMKLCGGKFIFKAPEPSSVHTQIDSTKHQDGKEALQHDETLYEEESSKIDTANDSPSIARVDITENLEQDQIEPNSNAFEVPSTAAEFKSRLDDISVKFQSTLNKMIEAIHDVNSLHESLKDNLLGHQAYLDQRGRGIHSRVQELQRDAATLHARASKGLA